MNETGSGRILSSYSLKLMAGGVSVLALVGLALLAVGVFSDNRGAADTSRQVPDSYARETSTSRSAPSAGAALLTSIEKSDGVALQMLIEGGADVNVSNTFGNPALHIAIGAENLEIVRILVESGANVDSKSAFGDPALHVAIGVENLEIVRILVASGANVDSKSAFGDPALHLAIQNGNSELVRMLVDAGADINAKNAFGDSALKRAVQKGDRELLQVLTGAGEG